MTLADEKDIQNALVALLFGKILALERELVELEKLDQEVSAQRRLNNEVGVSFLYGALLHVTGRNLFSEVHLTRSTH